MLKTKGQKILEGLVLTFVTVSTMYLIAGSFYYFANKAGVYQIDPVSQPKHRDFCQIVSPEMIKAKVHTIEYMCNSYYNSTQGKDVDTFDRISTLFFNT